jgi:hypothetical protein
MEKPDLINAFVSGIILFRIGKEYIYCKPPSAEDKTFADFFSQEYYEDCLIDGLWTTTEAEEFLISAGYWSKEENDNIKTISDNIDNMKLDYFNNFYNSQTKDYIKKNIDKQQEKLGKLHDKKYVFFDKTCEYVKSYAATLYLLQKNSFLTDLEMACNYYSIHRLAIKYNECKNDLLSRVREISKSDSWRNHWLSIKELIFANHPSTFTSFQHSIIGWSKYYDSIYQSPDKPLEEIIQDDIALDGWSIKERRKREEEEKKHNAEQLLPEKLSNAGEVFIPARNAKEVEDILSLNDAHGKAKLRSLKNDLKNRGSLKDSDLTSSRQEIQMQANRIASERKR